MLCTTTITNWEPKLIKKKRKALRMYLFLCNHLNREVFKNNFISISIRKYLDRFSTEIFGNFFKNLIVYKAYGNLEKSLDKHTVAL